MTKKTIITSSSLEAKPLTTKLLKVTSSTTYVATSAFANSDQNNVAAASLVWMAVRTTKGLVRCSTIKDGACCLKLEAYGEDVQNQEYVAWDQNRELEQRRNECKGITHRTTLMITQWAWHMTTDQSHQA